MAFNLDDAAEGYAMVAESLGVREIDAGVIVKVFSDGSYGSEEQKKQHLSGITSGGIYGTIVGLREDVVQLRIADQVKIEVSRSAIAGHQPTREESASS